MTTYRAFLSYSRADDREANWVHGKLDAYKTPSALTGTEGSFGSIPDSLHPIFRDRTDMAGGGQLSVSIHNALRESESLIVLCSPASAQSLWVRLEVETFISLGRADRIYPVIASNLPDCDDVEEAYFPLPLRGQGFLAADLRDIRLPGSAQVVGDGRRGGLTKLIAGLLGAPLDALIQRERQRRAALYAAICFVILLFAGISGVAAIGALTAQQKAAEVRELGNEVSQSDRRAQLSRLLSFSDKSREALESYDLPLAARYAIAGYRLAPENSQSYRSVLAAILQANVSAPDLLAQDDRLDTGLGDERLLRALDGIEDWHGQRSRTVAALQDLIKRTPDPYDGRPESYFNRTIRIAPEGTVELSGSRNDGFKVVLESQAVKVALSGDNIAAASLESDGTLKLWDAKDGRLIGSITTGITDPQEMHFVGEDASKIVVYTKDKASVWRTHDRSAMKTFRLPEMGGINDLVETPTGGFVSLIRIGSAYVFTFRRGGPQTTAIQVTSSIEYERLKLSADGSTVVAWGQNALSVFNASDGSLYGHHSPAADYFGDVILSRRGDAIIAVERGEMSFTTAVSLRRRTAGDLQFGARLQGGMFAVTPNLAMAITADKASEAAFVQVGLSEPTALRLPVYPSKVTAAALSPDNTTAIVGYANGRLMAYDVAARRALYSSTTSTAAINAIKFSEDGRWYAVSNGPGTLTLRSAQDGAVIRQLKTTGANIAAIAISRSSDTIVAGDSGGTIHIWEASQGRFLRSFPGDVGKINDARITPDGCCVIVAGTHDVDTADVEAGADYLNGLTSIRTWRIADGVLEGAWQTDSLSTEAIALSPDGSRLATVEYGVLSLWSVLDRRRIYTLRDAKFLPGKWRDQDDGVMAGSGYSGPIAFSTDGRFLASNQYRPAEYDRVDGRQVQLTPPEFRLAVWNVAFLTAPMERLVATACSTLLADRAARRFTSLQMERDSFLRQEWRTVDRDVCDAPPNRSVRVQ